MIDARIFYHWRIKQGFEKAPSSFFTLTSVKPKSNTRENTLKSSTQDTAKGKLHQVKGKIKEITGKVIMNPDLEAEGKKENRAGKVQEKLGEFKNVVGK